MTINTLEQAHYPFVKGIYEQGISTQNATLNIASPAWEAWDKEHLANCRFVAVAGKEVCGWIALSPVSGRCVYGGVAEVSVYIDEKHRGKGVGKALLAHLIPISEANGIWTLQAGILAENTASVRLHESCGFRIVGTREKIGKLNGVWRDVVLLERRSLQIV